MIYDFHTHTFLSDGELSPIELIRRALERGYQCVAITDHAGPGEVERFVAEVSRDCALAERYWQVRAIPGVELTHLPPQSIAEVAGEAKRLGARLVVVHGETPVEPVEPGTNEAAVSCPDVDILAHPGLLTVDEAMLARKNGVFIEVSARKGHSLANGHIIKVCEQAGAALLLGSDAHDEGDLLTEEAAMAVLKGAGLVPIQIREVMEANPVSLLARLDKQ